MSDCLKEFTTLGFKYPPNQVAAAALQQAGLAYCFQAETITEAIDLFRADIPKLEAHIRNIFGNVYDHREELVKIRRAQHGA